MVSYINKSGNMLSSPSTWILDSGASDHVCPHLHCFTSLYKIQPISVSFPNGTTLISQYCGSIKFSEQFEINNVLFLPQFRISLIFISQLTKIVDCKLMFSCNSCVLQDLHTQRTIGHVELISNLYILSLHSQGPACHADTSLHILDSNKIVADSSVSNSIRSSNLHDFDVWHYRLGHPSTSVLQHLCTTFPYISINKNVVCDFCPLAK